MGEELVNSDVAFDDELGALGLPLPRKRPRADQRDLPAQQVWAHVERDLSALTNIAGRSPGSCPPHRRSARLTRARSVERFVCAFPVGQLADRLDGVVGARIDHFVRAELAGESAPLE